MSAIRLVIVLLVAGVASVGLALTVRHMTASHPAVVQAAAAPVAPAAMRVLVARHDLTVGERLTPEDVAWVSWPKSSVNPAFITGGPVNPKTDLANTATAALEAVTNTDPAVQPLVGSLVREAILANDPLNARKLVKGGQGGFMAIKLPTGMRAMAMPVTVESGVGGFILPGDHVDVVLNVKMSGGSTGGPTQLVQSRTLMRNLTVLAIDQTTEAKAGASSLVGVSATLQVPADDVDELAKARDEGTLLLALRSYQDIDGPQGSAGPSAPRRAIQVRDTGETAVHVYRGIKLTAEKVP